MGEPRRERFKSAFQSFSRREQQYFIADLWAARGWETSVEGPLVVATRGGHTMRIAVVSDSLLGTHSPPSDATLVIPLGLFESEHAPVFSLDKLYDLARFGLPEQESDELFLTHFGRTFETSESGRTPIRWGRLLLILLILLVLLLVVAAAVITGIVPFELQTPTPNATPVTTTSATPTPEPRAIVPGLTSTGVENATVLAATHRDSLDNHSYRWTIGYRESIAGNQTGREVEVVSLEAPHRYASTVERSGTLRAFPRPTASEDAFADGSLRYARRPDEPDGVAVRVLDPDILAGPGRQAMRAEWYIDWYLSTDDSRVVNSTVENGTRLYQIVGSGNDFPRSVRYTVSAVVDENGFVRSLEASYETRDSVSVTVWFEYDAVDETTVSPPPWVVRER